MTARVHIPADCQEAQMSLMMQVNGIMLYSAGLPMFASNFTRDSILSAILFANPVMLRDQLVFSALMQGVSHNPFSGEEPGKIYHEMPPARLHGLSTEFNACDTTALFIIGHDEYVKMTGDSLFIKRQKRYLEKAVQYILTHLVNNLFIEDPKFCKNNKFALRVTYWKDSHMHTRSDGTPAYPAVFTLAHAQNMKALRVAARLLDAPALLIKAKNMLRHLSILFDEKVGAYHIGLDQEGFLTGISSDTLHILYYLEPEDIAPEKIKRIVTASRVLETPYGYRTLDPGEVFLDHLGIIEEGYHARTVWPFEQAFIHLAAKKFHLPEVMRIAEQVYKHLDTFPELFAVDDRVVRKGGAGIQLWTIAAKTYFARVLEK